MTACSYVIIFQMYLKISVTWLPQTNIKWIWNFVTYSKKVTVVCQVIVSYSFSSSLSHFLLYTTLRCRVIITFSAAIVLMMCTIFQLVFILSAFCPHKKILNGHPHFWVAIWLMSDYYNCLCTIVNKFYKNHARIEATVALVEYLCYLHLKNNLGSTWGALSTSASGNNNKDILLILGFNYSIILFFLWSTHALR